MQENHDRDHTSSDKYKTFSEKVFSQMEEEKKKPVVGTFVVLMLYFIKKIY